MNSKKVAVLLFTGLMFTAGASALSIDIDIIDFGGSETGNSTDSNSTEDEGNDQRFTYGGEDSDQITDKEGVEKSLMEQIVGAVVNTLFG